MPMIAASTGAAFLPSASPAARPSITTSTFSPTPAPTESIASSGDAARRVVERQRLHQQQLRALELRGASASRRPCRRRGRSACALTPMVPVIDDADDAGVDGRLGGQKRKRGFLAADEEHVLADAGADRSRPPRACGRPARASASAAGARSSLMPREVRVLAWSTTTSPMTRASCIGRLASSTSM